MLTHVNASWAYCEVKELEQWRREGGVSFEFVYNPVMPFIDKQAPRDLVRAAGPENCVLCTEAMAAFIGLLQQEKFTQNESRVMATTNASRLLDL